ncbi:carbamoyltransferase HypF [Helicobacter sp. MIT 21-1697]|uniref:carbamoyltransferase HypF n=1 Tax=Helicobacter sp. MIT 21-1697 TaxID=2993733 RepID=UPI00224AE278|nr:carbamoyltransferase HypF [Helicobacter sp. MIT 21-1697]MCX2717377.1 carbamoyltransferase HypF [Helicobacter sp. MIT 21-1697]
MKIYHIELFGIIQGVGFRPFVYHLAHKMGLRGYVQNRYTSLFICVEVPSRTILDEFINHILASPPPNARLTQHSITLISTPHILGDCFEIRESQNDCSLLPTLLPLDTRICEQCLADMKDRGRFFNYAFTTCTECGARYSIIHTLPYDRIHTSMRDFALCEQCQGEYDNPLSRRFHAQPNSCHQCAIQMRVIDEYGTIHSFRQSQDDIKLLELVAQKIKAGKIVAIKGVGGFNLVVSATNAQAIKTLRERKNRSHKPFAVMFKNLQDISSIASINEQETRALLSPQAPIVLLERDYQRAGIINEECLELIAPQIQSVGAILPYNGIMHLLFTFLDTPLIFTSANVSGEPIIADLDALQQKLGGENAVYDVILDYNRSISNPIDDSIVRCMAGKIRPLRLARGYAPAFLDFKLPIHDSMQESTQKDAQSIIMGVGAQQKATLSFIHKGANTHYQAVISPYIGDLHNVDSLLRYKAHYDFFTHLYAQPIRALGCDLHPNYASTHFAAEIENVQKYPLSHHKAHFYALLAESSGLEENGIGIIWDGTGLGEDGHIWGGECFMYEAYSQNNFCTMRRICHFEEFTLLGGESAIKEIGKCALSLLWHYDVANVQEKVHFAPTELTLLQSGFKSGIYPLTSSVGRIFDAVAYLLGLLEVQSYEGQSGAMIESCALRDYVKYESEVEPYEFHINQDIISLRGIIQGVIDEKNTHGVDRAAHRFLHTLAHIALCLVQKYQQQKKEPLKVYLSGGVFQNKFLCDRIHTLFTNNHISFFMHEKIPCNDASISFGQALFCALMQEKQGDNNESKPQ